MTPYTFSASQIDTYMSCPRKWGWIYIHGQRPPGTPATELGTAVHKQLEGYLCGDHLDTTVPAGPIAQAIAQHLPDPPVDEDNVEQHFMLLGRHRYIGAMDYVDPPVAVYDHKTTSSISKWAKDAVALATNVQAVIYATSAMVAWGVDTVDLQWNYAQTRGRPITRPLRVTMTAARTRELFDAMEDVADEMAAILHAGKRALDLAPTLATCSKYGGCPFQDQCLTTQERFRAAMTTGTSTDDLLSRLAKRAAINPPEGADPQKTPTQPPPADDPPPPPAMKSKRVVKAPAAEVPLIGTLYVDCVPQWPLKQFSDVVKEAADIIRATEFRGTDGAYHVADYRLLPFGQGPAALIAAVKQALGTGGADLVVLSHTAEASVCINFLLASCDRVVLGVR